MTPDLCMHALQADNTFLFQAETKNACKRAKDESWACPPKAVSPIINKKNFFPLKDWSAGVSCLRPLPLPPGGCVCVYTHTHTHCFVTASVFKAQQVEVMLTRVHLYLHVGFSLTLTLGLCLRACCSTEEHQCGVNTQPTTHVNMHPMCKHWPREEKTICTRVHI